MPTSPNPDLVLAPLYDQAALLRPPYVRPRRPVPDKFFPLTAANGFSVTGASASNLADTSDYVFGTSSVLITTAGGGTAGAGQVNLDNLNIPALDLTAGYLVVWVKVISGLANIHKLNVILGSGTTSLGDGYIRVELWDGASAPSDSRQIQEGEWVALPVLRSGVGSVSAAPVMTALTDLRLQVYDKGPDKLVTMRWGGLAYYKHANAGGTVPSTGTVSITFDDGNASDYELARPILDKYGYPATAYIIPDRLDTAGRLTTSQLLALSEFSGWSIGGHFHRLAHDDRLTMLSPHRLRQAVEDLRRWQTRVGGGDTIAYPGGSHDPAVVAAVRQWFSGARTIIPNTESLPPADPYRIRAYSSISEVTGGKKVSDVQALLTATATHKSWLNLVFHQIVPNGTATTTTQCEVQHLEQHMANIAASGLQVRTVDQVLRYS